VNNESYSDWLEVFRVVRFSTISCSRKVIHNWHSEYHCCIVMPACTVLQFYHNHFIDVYCHMFIPTCVTRVYVTQVKGIVLKILNTDACHDYRAAWGARLST